MFSPENWQGMPPWLSGVLMAIILSVLRVVYDKEETTPCRIAIESLICGALTLAAGSAVEAAGFGDKWHLLVGGIIGGLGSQAVRQFAYRAINRKVGE